MSDIQFLRAPQEMPEWRKLLEICAVQNVNPLVVACHSKHREERHVADRKKVLKALREAKWSVSRMATVCALSERRIREALDRV